MSQTPRTTLFTCSIHPDLTRVWYHFARRATDPARVSCLIYDCGSRLRPEHFPGARIVRQANVDHGRKIDRCVREAQTPLVFLSDDDSFLLSDRAEPLAAEALLADDRAAAFTFKPRDWWQWRLEGREHPVMGSYSLVFKPELIRRERLSFRTRPTTDPEIRKGGGYYDTADYANQELLLRGYRIVVPEPEVRKGLVRSFSAVSSGFLAFTRRSWFGGGYRLAKPRAELAQELRSRPRSLEWACGVAATRLLHRRLFPEPPRFDDFFDYDELAEIVREDQEGKAMVMGYRELLETLTP